jgi:hypothetical protein
MHIAPAFASHRPAKHVRCAAALAAASIHANSAKALAPLSVVAGCDPVDKRALLSKASAHSS